MKQTWFIDTEVFPDYFMLGMRCLETGAVQTFECHAGRLFPAPAARKLLRQSRLVSFNGNHFDMVLIAMALEGLPPESMKRACDLIIQTNASSWQIEREFGVKVEDYDHIDLIEVAPGKCSLKVFGGRLHVPTIRDLPFEPHERIQTEARRQTVRDYNVIDLQVTQRLYEELLPKLQLRERMGEQYGMDLRSRGDAQIGERVIASLVEELNGHPTPDVEFTDTFQYVPPEYIGFETVRLRALLDTVRQSVFSVDGSGKVRLPEAITAPITLGGGRYQFGIGGLHSSESSVAHRATGGRVLLDRDVKSYYPNLILGCGLYPQHMGPNFLTVYRKIVETRLAAKAAGDKATDEVLKILINGSFGKFGNKYSALCAPNLLIQVTITGQLALLMLIEHLELHGIQVVSANTDGIVISARETDRGLIDGLVAGWEMVTGLETEETEYSALYAKDVNNYIAIKKAGGVKRKGVYSEAGIAKNPQTEVCVDAVVEYLLDGVDVEDHISACADVRKFVSLRKVSSGAIDQQANFIGKTVRWYYAAGVRGAMRAKVNGYAVPKTDGARPLMELPDELPADIDYGWYVAEAKGILEDIGAVRRQQDLFNAA